MSAFHSIGYCISLGIVVGVTAPTLAVVDPYTVELHWRHPTTPNGPIIAYHLYRSVGGQARAVWYSGPGTVRSTVDNTTRPAGQYAYLLEASTAAGAMNSSTAAEVSKNAVT